METPAGDANCIVCDNAVCVCVGRGGEEGGREGRRGGGKGGEEGRGKETYKLNKGRGIVHAGDERGDAV